MGQYWMYFNLDKRTVCGDVGKLGESLPFGGFSKIRSRLVRPTKQDLREGAAQAIRSHKKNQKEYSDPEWEDTYTKEIESMRLVREQFKTNPNLDKNRPLGAFHKLPAELISMLFLAMDDYMDIAVLALTNTVFFEEGYSRLARLAEEAYSWAGDRLICVGDSCRIDDLPTGVFNSTEIDELRKLMSSGQGGDNDHGDRTVHDAFEAAMSGRLPSPMSSLLPSSWSWSLTNMGSRRSIRILLRMSKLDKDLYCYLEGLTRYDKEDRRYPLASEDRPWVLCNLTAGEYVRASAISKLRLQPGQDCELDYGPTVGRGLTFSEVVAARFCWSSDSGIAMVYEGDIHRGVWAGHRFEIVPLGHVRRLEGGQQWKDVSEEVAQEMKDLWKSEFEDEWQQRL
ncbi:hypothetical protein EIP91_010168 [Steccherinum ochraceum]|uniref:Uncharacterized protein n=1 Tax=Steccherinum ochraceum TaxID=92696 RepID=A0A4R0RW69_9APHY|nr:hypothetical protein EIP91_010168 [Steccherinum ochraceum]